MKGYLNRKEKDRMVELVMVALVAVADWLEWQAGQAKDRDDRKWLKTARSLVYKVADKLAVAIPSGQWNQVLNVAAHHQVSLIPNDRTRLRAKIAGERATEDYIMALAEYAHAGWCSDCKEDPSDCDLREVFEVLLIPKVDEQAAGCPYSLA